MLHLWLTEQPGYGANAPSATPALHFSVVTSKAASLPASFLPSSPCIFLRLGPLRVVRPYRGMGALQILFKQWRGGKCGCVGPFGVSDPEELQFTRNF